jgi:hypothetical protein
MDFHEMPNVMIINENEEKPHELIEDYIDMINYNLSNGIEINDLMWEFFNEINHWTVKQMLIDQAKQKLAYLQDLTEMDGFIEDEELEED